MYLISGANVYVAAVKTGGRHFETFAVTLQVDLVYFRIAD